MEQYEFVRRLGHGRFGEVWLVKLVKSKKQYVLKQINLQQCSKREQRAAYLEVKLLSTLKHPNIVGYLDSFYHSDGNLFILMSYCECGDLYNHIKNRNGIYFEEKQIVSWFVQICMALKHLHDRNILHRDLKTQNIFLTRTKLVKVGDLGIARILNGSHDMATTMIGTPYYMSPEIFSNKPYNHKSDVWALGCCVYEMATLEQAFNAHDVASLMQQVLNGKITFSSNQYSEEFLNIISEMMAHNPEDRPSVTEILLKSYIRKNIIVFLEETNKSLLHLNRRNGNSQKCSENKLLGERSSSKSVQPNHATSKKSNEGNKPLAFNHAQKPVIKEHCSISVPDVNGNGDGNDNSQHRSSYLYKKQSDTRSFSENSKENVNPSITHTLFANTNNMGNNRFLFMPTQNKFPRKQRTFMSHNAKSKAESSLQFLSNLTYTIKHSRSADNSRSSTREPIFCLPRISSDYSVHNASNAQRQFTTSPSQDCSFAASKIPSVSDDSIKQLASYQQDVCDNDKNGNSPRNNILEKSQCNLLEVPNTPTKFTVNESQISNALNSSLNIKCCTSATHVDRGLLQEISSSKPMQRNVEARRRRRERLDQCSQSSFFTKSAPASIEVLPAIFVNKQEGTVLKP